MIENVPDNWTDESSEELRQAVFDALFDPHPVDGREFPDPVEEWEIWKVTSADKNMNGTKVIVILERAGYKAVFTALRSPKDTTLWDSQIAYYNMQEQA